MAGERFRELFCMPIFPGTQQVGALGEFFLFGGAAFHGAPLLLAANKAISIASAR